MIVRKAGGVAITVSKQSFLEGWIAPGIVGRGANFEFKTRVWNAFIAVKIRCVRAGKTIACLNFVWVPVLKKLEIHR